jgi:hypothetical protein
MIVVITASKSLLVGPVAAQSAPSRWPLLLASPPTLPAQPLPLLLTTPMFVIRPPITGVLALVLLTPIIFIIKDLLRLLTTPLNPSDSLSLGTVLNVLILILITRTHPNSTSSWLLPSLAATPLEPTLSLRPPILRRNGIT